MRRGAIALALGLSLGLGCAHDAGRPLPEGRAAARFLRTDGTVLSLAALRGKVVLVTVLTTWNDIALLEIPLLKELYAQHAPELEIVCVALDDDPAMLSIFAKTFELPYPVVRAHDPARFTSDEGPLGPIGVLPSSALLDRSGRVVARTDGTWSPAVLQAAVEKLVQRKR